MKPKEMVILLDKASEYIIAVKNILQELPNTEKEIEMGILQQYLDEDELYVKQVPTDKSNMMRAVSDCVYYSQSQYQVLVHDFLKGLIAASEIPELDSLLIMTSSKNTGSYIKQIKDHHQVRPEVDIVLLSLILDLDVKWVY